MPREVKQAKEFLELFNEPAASSKKQTETAEKKTVNKPKNIFKKRLIVKAGKRITKFKLRTSKRLYTFKTDNAETAKKIQSSLPSHITLVDLQKKKTNKKK